MILGVDVGSPQGELSPHHWVLMKMQGRLFAFLRCAEALYSVDPTFAGNVVGARAAELEALGAYFVFHPWVDPEAQAASWYAASAPLRASGAELPPVLDVELDHPDGKTKLDSETIRAGLVRCIRKVTELWGRAPIVYSFPDFWARDILAGATGEELAVFASCPLWWARYGQATPPAAPKPWTTITLWQRGGGDTYRTPNGIGCDDDAFLGELEELEALYVPDAPVADALAGAPPAGLVVEGENG
jgi:GH25 family lysozyme M1 (1,4-beta-N-acetylmuramidase)